MFSGYLTTSRKPSPVTRRLARALAHFFNMYYENRGKSSLDEVQNSAKSRDFKYLMILSEFHGNPSQIVLYDVEGNLVSKIRFNPIKIISHKEWPKDVIDDNELPFSETKIPEVFFPFIGTSQIKSIMRNDRLLILKGNNAELIVLKLK